MTQQMFSIEKSFDISSAKIIFKQINELESYGYDYKLSSKIYSDKIIDENLLISFQTEIDKFFKDTIIAPETYVSSKQNIHILLPVENISTEFLCSIVHNLLSRYLKSQNISFKKIAIRISETDNNLAEYSE